MLVGLALLVGCGSSGILGWIFPYLFGRSWQQVTFNGDSTTAGQETYLNFEEHQSTARQTNSQTGLLYYSPPGVGTFIGTFNVSSASRATGTVTFNSGPDNPWGLVGVGRTLGLSLSLSGNILTTTMTYEGATQIETWTEIVD